MLPKMQDIATDSLLAEVAAEMPTLPSVKTSLYRSRRARLPPLPQSRSDIQLEGDWTKTTRVKRFFLSNDGDENRIIIFPTDDQLAILANADTIYMDGTFECCPRLFYQVFTLNISFFRGNQQFPVVYVLLPGKSRETYNRAFTHLKEAAQKIKYQTGL